MVLLSLQHAQELGIARNVLFAESLARQAFWRKLSSHELKEHFLKDEFAGALEWLTRNDEKVVVEEVLVHDKEMRIFVKDRTCKHVYEWTRAEFCWHGAALSGRDATRLFFVSRHFVNQHVSEASQRKAQLVLPRLVDEEEARAAGEDTSRNLEHVDNEEEQDEGDYMAVRYK